eukprot:m.136909 g.136909  ORF g.136909 m.136909 type:complete len:309 (+) comp29893_c5_seq1:87-1013(+)
MTMFNFNTSVLWLGALCACMSVVHVSGGMVNRDQVMGNGSTVMLNSKQVFPSASFGLEVYDDDTAKQYTIMAVKAGFRNFFSSVLAGNQQGFGEGIQASGIDRSEVYICGSVNTGNGACSGFDDCKTQTAQGCQSNLDATQLKYLDQIMLDYPAGDCDSIQGQWAAFEDMLKSGLTKSIAVSNFDNDQLDCIVTNKTSTPPAVNQLSYSVGDGSQTVVQDNMQRGGIVVQAYSPLQGGGLASDPDCVAIGKAHSKSGAQVALRWIVQHNATFTTSCTTMDYFQEDIDIFDFELSSAEMAKLDAKSVSQ